MNYRVFLFLLPLIYILFLYGCKKDADTISPQIVSIAPSENTHYNTFDTINVRATITDERELTFVSVELLNADLISVITPFGRSLSTKEYNLNASLIIDNLHLTSGTHYILITAKDSRNTTREYIEVNVSGIPYETRGYVTYENFTSQFEVHSYFNNTDTILYQGTGELMGGLVDNYYQQFGILYAPNGPFKVLPLYPFIHDWELDIQQGGFTFCRAQADKKSIQLGFKDQILSFYEGEGILKSSFVSAINYYPQYSLDDNENIVTWQRSSGASYGRIETFFKSGALKQVTNYTKDIVQFIPKTTLLTYILSNENSNGYMDIYNLENGILDIHEFENNTVFDACINNEENLFIASATGIIKYNSYTHQFTSFSDLEVTQIEWDIEQGILLATTNTELILLNTIGMVVQSYPLSGECVELSVWYSK